ncbi:hypothetical protein ACVIYH_003797 [Bradyrhizobium diazoefficiens]
MNGGSTSPLRGRIADGTANPADQLSGTLDYRAFVPFLIASIVIAAAYGTSFLLPDYMHALETDGQAAGLIISSGMATTLVSCCLAGWLAKRIGLLPTLTVASLFMALAMLAFAGAALDTRAAYGGGLLVGRCLVSVLHFGTAADHPPSTALSTYSVFDGLIRITNGWARPGSSTWSLARKIHWFAGHDLCGACDCVRDRRRLRRPYKTRDVEAIGTGYARYRNYSGRDYDTPSEVHSTPHRHDCDFRLRVRGAVHISERVFRLTSPEFRSVLSLFHCYERDTTLLCRSPHGQPAVTPTGTHAHPTDRCVSGAVPFQRWQHITLYCGLCPLCRRLWVKLFNLEYDSRQSRR